MRRALLVALALTLGAAAPAAAQNGSVGGAGAGYPLAGPVFGAGELLWVERDEGLNLRLVAGDVGRRAEVLATATAPLSAQSVTTSFGASDSTVLFWAMFEHRVKGIEEPLQVTALAGPRGALRPLGDGGGDPFRLPQVAGERVAFPVFLGGGAAIRVLDPVSGARSDVPIDRSGYPWSAAGDVVAHRAPTEAREPAVTNWRTGAELYRAAPPAGWEVVAVDVTADGTAVWTATTADGSARPYVHGVSTPESPAIRPIPLPADAVVQELAAGRVLYRSQQDWAIADLDGRVLARLPGQVPLAPPGTDGRRLAYLTRPCAIPVVQVYEFETPPAPKGVPPAPCVAARLAGRPAVGRDGLRVPLRCDGAEGAGCVTGVTVDVRRHGRRRLRFHVPDASMVAGEERVIALGRRRSLRGRLRVTVALRAVRDGGAREVRRFRVRG